MKTHILARLTINKHKLPQEKSSSHNIRISTFPNEPIPVQESENNMALIPKTHCLSNNKALRVAQWLAQVEPGEQDVPFPGTSLSSTTPAPSSNSNAGPVTTSAVPEQHATTGLSLPSPTQQPVYRYGRPRARLVMGAPEGWAPDSASFLPIGPPVSSTGTVAPTRPAPPRPSPSRSLQGASELDRARVPSSGQAVLQKPGADPQSTSKTGGGSTFAANDKTPR
jgi:hypothetical protein